MTKLHGGPRLDRGQRPAAPRSWERRSAAGPAIAGTSHLATIDGGGGAIALHPMHLTAKLLHRRGGPARRRRSKRVIGPTRPTPELERSSHRSTFSLPPNSHFAWPRLSTSGGATTKIEPSKQHPRPPAPSKSPVSQKPVHNATHAEGSHISNTRCRLKSCNSKHSRGASVKQSSGKLMMNLNEHVCKASASLGSP